MMSDTMFVCLLLQTNNRSIPISYFLPLYFLRYYHSIITIIVNVITINVVLTVIIFKSVFAGIAVISTCCWTAIIIIDILITG